MCKDENNRNFAHIFATRGQMKDKKFFIKIELSFGYLLWAQKFILGDLFSKSNKIADVKGGLL